jgi:hypothetical protein
MDVLSAAKELNQRAAREKWYYYCDPSLAFVDSFHDPLLKLWRAKAGTCAMPRRSQFTARDLKDVLRNIVVFERVARDPSRYKFRLVGTGLYQMAPGEQTGKMIEETLPPDHVERWIQCIDLVLYHGQPVRFLGRVHLKGKEYLDAENLFVPLANDSDEPTFAMALCHYTPRRTEDEQTWECRIASVSAGLM